jgi:hypothetical protein
VLGRAFPIRGAPGGWRDAWEGDDRAVIALGPKNAPGTVNLVDGSG